MKRHAKTERSAVCHYHDSAESESYCTTGGDDFAANYIEWKVGDRCEALYKEDNKYYPGKSKFERELII